MPKKKIHIFKLPWSSTPLTKEENEQFLNDCEKYMEPSKEEIEEWNRRSLEERNNPDNEIIVHDFTNYKEEEFFHSIVV